MREAREETVHDEDDWSQISNQAMRKRVQNRLAQRKHRKSIKARLKELEQLAAKKDSTTPPTQPSESASAAARNPPPLAKDQAASMADLTTLDVTMLGGGFTQDGSAANYMYPHPPSNYAAVGGDLNMDPALLTGPDLVFPNPFAVSGRTGDGGLSPSTTNLLAQGYAHTGGAHFQGLTGEMDSLGRYLDQHRQAMECHDLQSHGKSSTASSWVSSERPSQSTDQSTIPDRILPSDSVSACENEANVGAMSKRPQLAKHHSRRSSGSPHSLDAYASSTDLEGNQDKTSRYPSTRASARLMSGRRSRNAPPAAWATDSLSIKKNKETLAEASGTLSSRIESSIQAIRGFGFSSIEDLAGQFYTADLGDRPALAAAQRISRRRGLTRILAKVREHAKDDWTDWEAQGYREETIRAAEDILGDECRRFSEKDGIRGGSGSSSSSRRGRNSVDLKRRFQDELPNLYDLLGVLSLASERWGDADHSTVIVDAINLLLHGEDPEG